jgi:hypothetical protein
VQGIGPGDNLDRMHDASSSNTYTLARHPQSPSGPVAAIEATVSRSDNGILTLVFILTGELTHIIVPKPRQSQRAAGLWQHTCFEVFVMAGTGPGYSEFNFSPSGEWAAYVFERYREGKDLPMAAMLQPVSSREPGRLEVTAQIGQDVLPVGDSLRLGLSAVIEHASGERSYWALGHPRGTPDFHDAAAFTAQLD